MSRHSTRQEHLNWAELEQRYRAAEEPNERTWWPILADSGRFWPILADSGRFWPILWLLSQGRTGREVATVTGYSPYWIGQIAKRYNQQGRNGMRNRRHTTSHRAPPALTTAQQEEVRQP
jgi:hypothetical protein